MQKLMDQTSTSAEKSPARKRARMDMEQQPWGAKVAVLGAAGGIGQPLSLLLKQSSLIGELVLYDIVGTPGVGADLCHIDTPAKVSAYLGPKQLDEALQGCDVVVMTAGKAQKPGMTRDDLFGTNAKIVKCLAEACAKNCPQAMLCIITNPINSVVPIASEVYKKEGCYDSRRIFGVNALDVVRSRTFVSEAKNLRVDQVSVPVVGGHSGHTILPLLSQTKPAVSFTDEEVAQMTDKVQDAANVVVNIKGGAGSATLSTAYAAVYFVLRLLNAIQGKTNVIECAYVKSEIPEVAYLATPLLLGRNGIEKNLGLGRLSEFENKKFREEVIPELLQNIKKGEDFFKASSS